MLKKVLLLVVVGIFAVLVGYNRLVAASGNADFEMFDSCRNVRFKITNNRNIAIDVKQVKYFNATKNEWKTETINSIFSRCERGATCVISYGEDLANVEGDRLTKIVFVFEDVNSNTKHESQQFSPSDPVCRVDKEYGHGQNWTISGTSDASSQNGLSEAGGKCKNVTFLVTNNSTDEITITKVNFFNRNSRQWKTENVGNVSCSHRETCTIGGRDDLADANNNDLTRISFTYYTTKWMGSYFEKSAAKDSKIFNPQSPRCTEGKVYGTGQHWEIGNVSDNRNSNNSATTSTSSNSPTTQSTKNRRRGKNPQAQTNQTTEQTVTQPAQRTTNTQNVPLRQRILRRKKP